jgi:hypothetical protein
VGGQFAWAKCEITLDGIKVDNGNLEDQGYHYSVLNRTFSNDRVRREKYGQSMVGLANSKERVARAATAATEAREERGAIVGLATVGAGATTVLAAARAFRAYVPAVPLYTHPNLAAAMEGLQFDDARVSEPLLFRLGFDSIFPLSSENNALRQLSGQKNGTGQLRPGCKINIILHRRGGGDHILVERMGVTDAEYWAGADLTDAQKEPGLVLEIESLELCYETAVLEDPRELDRVRGVLKPLRYYHDVCLMRTNQLEPGVLFDAQKVVLPQHCRFLYLVFCHEVQTVDNARKYNFLSTRYRWPPGLSSVKLDLLGRDGLIFKEGIQGLGVKAGHHSVSLAELHANMVRKGMYEGKYDDWFPPERTAGTPEVGYQQVLLVDLLPYMDHFDKSMVNLSVALKYDTASLARWSLRTYAMVQRCYEYSAKTRWTWRDI